MTTYAWPAALIPASFEALLVPNVRNFQSPYAGSTQSLDLLGERWRFIVTLPPCSQAKGAAREAFFNRIMGQHRVALHHMMRPIPRGTMRGSPVLAAGASQGAATLSVAGAGAGATLLAGDMVGVGSQLFQNATDTTADGGGGMVITLVNRPRAALSGSAAVVWSKPTADFLMMPVPTQYVPGFTQSQVCEFMEAW